MLSDCNMYLCIDSTQRNSHHLVLLSENIRKEQIFESPSLLEAVDNFLFSENIAKEKLQGIAVVVGSGTFSSVRGAVTLANAWHYALGIPVVAITQEELLNTELCFQKLTSASNDFILPTYSAPPNIRIKETLS